MSQVDRPAWFKIIWFTFWRVGSMNQGFPRWWLKTFDTREGGGEQATEQRWCRVHTPFQTSHDCSSHGGCRSRIMARLSAQLAQNADSQVRVAKRSPRPPNARRQ